MTRGVWASQTDPARKYFHYKGGEAGFGSGTIWNRHNLAQQECAKLCRGIFRSVAIFLGVIIGALGIHIPLVPAQTALQGPFGRLQTSRNNSDLPKATGNKNAVYACCATIWEVKFSVVFKKFSPHQIFIIPHFARTNHPPPPPPVQRLLMLFCPGDIGVITDDHTFEFWRWKRAVNSVCVSDFGISDGTGYGRQPVGLVSPSATNQLIFA